MTEKLLESPRHRAILAVDIEGSTMRTNPAKAWLRHLMYALVESALLAGGIAEEDRDPFIDRGDGLLVLIHPVDRVPKARLLDTVVPTLHMLLSEQPAYEPHEDIRLRVAVHAGEIHYDGNGCFGEALDVTFRLLDSPPVKRKLRQTPGSLVLVVSDEIYRAVVRHGYQGIDEHAFEPVVTVRVAGQPHRGWSWSPGAVAGPRAALTVGRTDPVGTLVAS